jgi:hypothetical protein
VVQVAATTCSGVHWQNLRLRLYSRDITKCIHTMDTLYRRLILNLKRVYHDVRKIDCFLMVVDRGARQRFGRGGMGGAGFKLDSTPILLSYITYG